MADFLEKTLSESRLATYQDLSGLDKGGRTAFALYSLNLIYSKELYVVLAGLEVALRNNFHQALTKVYQTDKWFDHVGEFRDTHIAQIQSAKDKIIRKKKSFTVDDLVAELSYGFWVHLLDKPYEQIFWNKGLRHCFPKYGQAPSRAAIEKSLNLTLKLRNNIAHLEPIIKNEDTLIQEYRNIVQLLYSICPETQEWFCSLCNFENEWNNRFKERHNVKQ